MADFTKQYIEKFDASVDLIDMSQHDLPFCDGKDAYENETVKKLKKLITPATAVIIATPIYNFGINSVIKNLIELTGNAWKNKIIAFLCKAGGNKSYMSVMSLANSLMLDFRCLIVPRFVYALSSDFDDVTKTIKNDDIKIRIQQMSDYTIKLAKNNHKILKEIV